MVSQKSDLENRLVAELSDAYRQYEASIIQLEQLDVNGDVSMAVCHLLTGCMRLASRLDHVFEMINERERSPSLLQKLKARLPHKSTEPLSLGHLRALALDVAYSNKFHLDSSTDTDGRMVKAQEFVAALEGKSFHDPVGTIDRSVRRYRHSLKGKKVLNFDWEKLRVEVQDADDVYFPNLPKAPGRPKRQSGSKRF